MVVATLKIDGWIYQHDHSRTVDHPTVEQIETATRELDGHRRTVVTLEAADESYLASGGGDTGKEQEVPKAWVPHARS